jgi:hypothetical protein
MPTKFACGICVLFLTLFFNTSSAQAQGALEYLQDRADANELERQFCVRKHSTLAEWRFLDLISRLRNNAELVSKLQQLCEHNQQVGAAKAITILAYSDFAIIGNVGLIFIDADASITDISEFLLINARKSLEKTITQTN